MHIPEKTSLAIAVRREGAQASIALSGSFTFAAHAAFRAQVLDEIGRLERGGSVVIELGEVGFVDSAALGMMLLARDAAKARGAGVFLRGAVGQVERMLAVSKFDTLFTVGP